MEKPATAPAAEEVESEEEEEEEEEESEDEPPPPPPPTAAKKPASTTTSSRERGGPKDLEEVIQTYRLTKLLITSNLDLQMLVSTMVNHIVDFIRYAY